MSSLVYPSALPGLSVDVDRTPIFRTRVTEAVSGKESRLQLMVYPLFEFVLSYEWLDDSIAVSHLKSLAGLYMSMRGRADTFLYTDPTFGSVTDYQFGTGDGTTTAFQLTATWQNAGGPGYPELIQNVNGAVTVKKAGVTQTGGGVNYTLGGTGLVTFTAAPTAGQSLTWTGAFYYRCRFADDRLTLRKFMRNWWETRTVKFRSVKL